MTAYMIPRQGGGERSCKLATLQSLAAFSNRLDVHDFQQQLDARSRRSTSDQ